MLERQVLSFQHLISRC